MTNAPAPAHVLPIRIQIRVIQFRINFPKLKFNWNLLHVFFWPIIALSSDVNNCDISISISSGLVVLSDGVEHVSALFTVRFVQKSGENGKFFHRSEFFPCLLELWYVYNTLYNRVSQIQSSSKSSLHMKMIYTEEQFTTHRKLFIM